MGLGDRDQGRELSAEVRRRYDDEADELGGDPVCWIQYVCTRCGSIIEGPSHELTCRER